MIKKLLFGSLISVSAVAAPAIVSSCSLPEGDINRGQQADLLGSDAAKNTVLDSWLTTTFTSLYVQSKYPNTKSFEKLKETYMYFLDNLSWPDTTSSTNANKYENIEQSNKTEFENLLKDAYKFYISFKSTIKESGEKPLSPNVYFLVKANGWQSEELNTINPVKDQNGKLLTINDFNPGTRYTGLDSSNQVIEKDYKILMQTRGTLTYQNVMKLLLTEMYFLKNNKKLIENGTDYRKSLRGNTVTSNNYRAYVTGEDFSTFALKKYLVESSPQLTWSYAPEDYSNPTPSASIISTLIGFNNLSVTKDTTLGNIIAPNSNETEANSITKLQAYNKFELSTSSDNGDLSNTVDNIKMYGDNKIGLLDNDKKLLFTFSELNAIKEARTYNKSNNNALMIPSINISERGKNKNAYAIEISDLDISWGGSSSTTTKDNTFTYTNGNVTQTLIINSISFLPANGNNKTLNIGFTYKFNTNTSGQPNTEHSFDHNFEISNWGKNDSSPSNPFMNAFYFTGAPEQVGIKIFNDAAAIGITYYLRVLPIFKRTGSTPIQSDRYMVGTWSFENTPWSKYEEQKKLAYFFALSDENLYAKIQNFYLFNNFDYAGNVSELSTIISSLNLTKKTHADRVNEGIVF